MWRPIPLLTAALILIPSLSVHASAWTVDQAESSIQFQFTQGANETNGRFEQFTANIVFDPADLSAAVITAEIDVTSFNSGNSQIDEAVQSADWLYASDHPMAMFTSTEVTEAGDGTYAITGDLVIRGQSLPVTLLGPIIIDGDTAEAVVEVTLDRAAHGIGQGDLSSGDQVGLQVPVTITIQASR